MDFRPWIGVILASVVNMVWFSQLYPVYAYIRTMIFNSDVLNLASKWLPGNMIGILDTSLYWTPLIILGGTIIYAVIASIVPREATISTAPRGRW